MKKSILLIVFIMLFSILGASEASIKIDISSKNIAIGETVNLTATANGMDSTKDMQLNGLEEFDIIGSSSGMSKTFINGKYRAEAVIQLTLMPKKIGRFEIYGSVITKNINSNKVIINVSGSNENKIEKNEENNGKSMFLNSSKIPLKAYFGEKIPIIVDFYTKNQLSQAGFLEQPVYNGFVISDLEKEQGHYQILNNERYGKYNLQKSVLQAVKTGKIKIKPYTFRVNYVNDYAEIETKDFMTNEVNIDILPLPEPKPEGFQNLVGNLVVESSILGKNINFGESITVKIKLSGECNLDSIEKIYPDSIDGVKIYQTVKSKKEEIQSGKYYTEKEIEAVFIPEQSGKIVVPDIDLSYFNTEKGIYESKKIKSFEIEVSGNVKNSNLDNKSSLNNKKKEMLYESKISIIEENETKKLSFNIAKNIAIFGCIFLVGAALIYLILKKDICFKKKYSLNELIEKKYDLNLKISSKEDIVKKIKDKLICEKVILIVEEKEKEKLGFDYDIKKIKEYTDIVIKELKKKKK